MTSTRSVEISRVYNTVGDYEEKVIYNYNNPFSSLIAVFVINLTQPTILSIASYRSIHPPAWQTNPNYRPALLRYRRLQQETDPGNTFTDSSSIMPTPSAPTNNPDPSSKSGSTGSSSSSKPTPTSSSPSTLQVPSTSSGAGGSSSGSSTPRRLSLKKDLRSDRRIIRQPNNDSTSFKTIIINLIVAFFLYLLRRVIECGGKSAITKYSKFIK
ncbi:uncharacterized protein LOC129760967 [Uranotaenia lowii]|uniref:uncharacterized protein LOC129760967 n=1 Tax=Uranotaenia lowii TaxID=190385 RepID=UPI0024786C1C|nr:uncharacterized protein LOC129760967 [Uranotaenia lowii]